MEITLNGQYLYFGDQMISFVSDDAAKQFLLLYVLEKEKQETIFIVYDNDTAGREGAKKIASMLKDAGAFPHVVTGHYDVCKEKGEDLWDFFKKHGKT